MISRAGHYEPIAREGYPFFVPLGILSLILWWFGWPWPSLFFLILSIAVASFFRNPERTSPQGAGRVLSPADGRVVQIAENVRSDYLPNRVLTRISIFMSVFNVHVNRWPLSGLVKKITHVPGTFLDARMPAASVQNEHNSVVIESPDGTIEVVQIAGKIARRIACWVSEGDEAFQGERFGLIRFGSRLDVYMPPEFTPEVVIGTKVRAGVTVIARRKDPPR
ncbi:MAG TPA: phosphatidylserine decarboxylase family protein [Desulfomonilaceae bacterium]|nr:phosphatidylserine decarboxylase family protein [Desulfomonilaceae bacterium]